MKVVRNIIPQERRSQARKTIAIRRAPQVADELRIALTAGGKVEFYSTLVEADGMEHDQKVYFRLNKDEAAALRSALSEII